jgi:hypothetical protein
MYEIHADVKKNRVYIVLKEFMNDEQMKAAADKTIREIDKLRPGFAIITDISQYKPASPEGAKEIERAQAYAQQKGLKRVIRITGDIIGFMQFQRIASKGGYVVDIVNSIEEADKLLDNQKK